jgi:hypothetical protein
MRLTPELAPETMLTSHDRIARRAYELFEAYGKQHGQHWADWFQAERDIRDHSRALLQSGGPVLRCRTVWPFMLALILSLAIFCITQQN